MSVTDPRTTRSTDVRGPATDNFHRDTRETKPWYMTTEFWIMLIGLGAIAVIYNAANDVSFNLWRAMILATVVGVAYIVSRGLSKSGSHDTHTYYDDDNNRRY